MSKFLHGLLHVGLVVLNVAQLASGAIPAPYNVIIAAVVGGIQTAIGLYNHPSDAAPVVPSYKGKA